MVKTIAAAPDFSIRRSNAWVSFMLSGKYN